MDNREIHVKASVWRIVGEIGFEEALRRLLPGFELSKFSKEEIAEVHKGLKERLFSTDNPNEYAAARSAHQKLVSYYENGEPF